LIGFTKFSCQITIRLQFFILSYMYCPLIHTIVFYIKGRDFFIKTTTWKSPHKILWEVKTKCHKNKSTKRKRNSLLKIPKISLGKFMRDKKKCYTRKCFKEGKKL
jgi:hypothetical protein